MLFRVVFIAVLFAGLAPSPFYRLSVGADAVSVPPAVKNVIDKMDADIRKAKQKAIDELKRLRTITTKNGDLKGANAIQGQMEALEKDRGELRGELPLPATISRSLEGTKWKDSRGKIIEFIANGKAVDESIQGKWSVEPDGAIEIDWSNQTHWTMYANFKMTRSVIVGPVGGSVMNVVK